MELDGTGSAIDSATGTLSFWWHPAGTDSNGMTILVTNSRISVSRAGGDNSIRVILNGTSGGSEIEIRQDTSKVASLTASSGWCWVAADWDNNTEGACHLYVANAATSWVATDCTTRIDDTGGGNVIDWDDFDWSVGAAIAGSGPLSGCLSEVYLSTTRYDLSSSANRDLFYNSSTHRAAADLTSQGSPFIYLKNPFGSFTSQQRRRRRFYKEGHHTVHQMHRAVIIWLLLSVRALGATDCVRTDGSNSNNA